MIKNLRSCYRTAFVTTLNKFPWSQGVLQNHGISGANLILKYQWIYGLSASFGKGIMGSDGIMVSNSVRPATSCMH